MVRRTYGERELGLIRLVLESGELGCLSGKFTSLYEERFASMIGTKYAVAMNSAMSVLHASVMCSENWLKGGEVICDPIFIFGPMAALYANMIPRFVDIDPVTHTMDPTKLEDAITKRTKAIIVTHAWGLPADMDPIVKIARRHDILVIEDCAHAILAKYKGRCAGSLGDIGSFSFQASKQMSLGDGGMATTGDGELAKRLDLNAGAPTFHSVGYGLYYNYRMNELTSAAGMAQLEWLPQLIEGLVRNAHYYDEAISGCGWLKPQRADYADSTYHFWAATFQGEQYGIGLDDFKEGVQKFVPSINIGYTLMPAYRHPVIRERLAHIFHCKGAAEGLEYPNGLCPRAEHIFPRMVLNYTLKPEEEAKNEAAKLREMIQELEGGTI
jgi:perosamine synthetase